MNRPTSETRAITAARLIRAFGIAQTLVLAIYLIASPFFAAVFPFYRPSGPEGMGAWLITLSGIPESIASAARGNGPLRNPSLFVATYGGLLSLSTIFWVAGLTVLGYYRDAINETHARSIVRWSVVFVAVLILATPVIVHDLWLSVAWGRMVAEGSNPYYTHLSPASDLPYRGVNPGRATYGPLWTLISGIVAFLARGNALAIAAVQKILIAGCWFGVIHTVRELVNGRTAFAQCTALVLVGWAPLVLFIGIADGHNDPLMVLPMLLWLLWLERGRTVPAALALGVSISIKYVSWPLLFLHSVRGFSARGRERRAVLLSLAAAGALIILFLAVFYRSPRFFDAARHMRNWRFLTPASAVATVAGSVGIASRWLMPAIDLAVIAISAMVAGLWLRTPSREGFRAAVLWTLGGAMLSLLGHVWPWFILWLLPLAAIQPERRIAWFVIGMTAAAPFCSIPWASLPDLKPLAVVIRQGVFLYLAAIGAVLMSGPARRWLAKPGDHEL